MPDERPQSFQIRSTDFNLSVRAVKPGFLFVSIFLSEVIMPVPDMTVFSSDHHSPYKKTYKEPTPEYKRNDFVRQIEGPQPASGDADMARHRGLNNTKFGRGFQRRRVENIVNPITQQNDMHKEMVSTRKQAMNTSRSQKLIAENYRSGYNLLTGDPRGSGPVDVKCGKKFIDTGAFAESRRSCALTVLKNSGGRYHAIEDPPPRHENNRPATLQLY